jgi:hypothetical protein
MEECGGANEGPPTHTHTQTQTPYSTHTYRLGALSDDKTKDCGRTMLIHTRIPLPTHSPHEPIHCAQKHTAYSPSRRSRREGGRGANKVGHCSKGKSSGSTCRTMFRGALLMSSITLALLHCNFNLARGFCSVCLCPGNKKCV